MLLLSFYATSGHPAEEIAKLLASDGAVGDKLGWSVAVDGDTAVAGAFQHDHQGEDSGAAYVFVRKGDRWTQQAELLPSDGAAGDQAGFGQVAVDGDTVLLGALSHDNEQPDSGAVYVFARNGTSWTQQAKLLASDREQGDQFGVGVALSGDAAVIGANGDVHPDGSRGSAYIFVRNGNVWTQQAKLTGDPTLNVGFPGFAAANVDIDGDTVVVGAPTTDPLGRDSGTTYIFVRNGSSWTRQAQLVASDGMAEDQFGSSNALDGDTLLIGANAGHSRIAAGSAYVFTRNAGIWTEHSKLVADDAAAGDVFGGVALAGNTAVISASNDDDQGTDSGSAYVFIRNGLTWSQQTKILPTDGAAGDGFGVTLAMDGETVIVGAWQHDHQDADSGSAYIFQVTGPESQETGPESNAASTVIMNLLLDDNP